MNNEIYVVGDIHGDWEFLNTFINKKNPGIILQVGDYGWWPAFDGKHTLGKITYSNGLTKSHPWYLNGIKNPNTKIHWCDGNHEDHWALKDITDNETQPNCFYQKRGSTMTLPDGRVVLFMGGAYSIDKSMRTMGVDWFPEETISWGDMMNLPDCKVDIVISHTCPVSFLPYLNIGVKANDPSCEALENILLKYRPTEWFHGHWHLSRHGYVKGCNIHCLNVLGRQGGWMKL